MAKYRKKLIVVEAMQYKENHAWEIEKWARSEGKRNVVPSPVLEPSDENPTGAYLQVHTLEGVMIANVGDYIIKGVQGEFYPCKPGIFEMTYDKIED